MLEATPWIGVICATVATMMVGAAWYGGLAQPWMKAAGVTEEQVKAGASPMLYVIAIIAHFVMAMMLSGLIFHVSPQGGNGMASSRGWASLRCRALLPTVFRCEHGR